MDENIVDIAKKEILERKADILKSRIKECLLETERAERGLKRLKGELDILSNTKVEDIELHGEGRSTEYERAVGYMKI